MDKNQNQHHQNVPKPTEEKAETLKLIRMSEIATEQVKWLWYPYIPFGKITVIQGDPGDGKTTAVLAINYDIIVNSLSLNQRSIEIDIICINKQYKCMVLV